MAHVGAIRACFEARNDGSLKGTVTTRWLIDARGAVVDADIASSTLANTAVEGCILHQIERWQFPSAGRPTRVEGFPFKFGEL
jgi:hypothetical protein